MIHSLFLLAQQVIPVVPVVPPGTPALPVQETNQLLSQVTSAALTIYVLKMIKQQAWYQALMPASASARKMVSRVLSGAGALVGAVGIHYAFHAVAGQDGTYVLTVSGLQLSSVLHGAWHWANQMALQQTGYDLVVKPTIPTA